MRALVLVVLPVVFGCGAHAPDSARQIVTAVDEVQIVGVKAFEAFDDQHQDAILASADPAETIRAKVRTYRVQQKRVALAFHALANVSHAFKATIDAYEAGRVKQVDWGSLIAGVVSSAKALKNIADAIPVKIHGLDTILGLGVHSPPSGFFVPSSLDIGVPTYRRTPPAAGGGVVTINGSGPASANTNDPSVGGIIRFSSGAPMSVNADNPGAGGVTTLEGCR